MRMSDWSSDVCSSDLERHAIGGGETGGPHDGIADPVYVRPIIFVGDILAPELGAPSIRGFDPGLDVVERIGAEDRKRVVSGKSVSVSVDFGSRRIHKKKNI